MKNQALKFTSIQAKDEWNFNGRMIMEFCAKWKIKHSNPSLYRPKMNGIVETANKNIKKIMQKMVFAYKDWY